jgi:hypothetical protein
MKSGASAKTNVVFFIFPESQQQQYLTEILDFWAKTGLFY